MINCIINYIEGAFAQASLKKERILFSLSPEIPPITSVLLL